MIEEVGKHALILGPDTVYSWHRLAALMGVTRGYHFTPLEHLPSASWAVFFLAGISLSSRWVFPAVLAEAALLDFAAVRDRVCPAVCGILPTILFVSVALRRHCGCHPYRVTHAGHVLVWARASS